uniref:Discs, large (Drosophila) homolog-associated protein 2b n=1 Tax=Neogobius melanostomus TaxID=47308 RepID=A0A8C6SRT4_9GOBI
PVPPRTTTKPIISVTAQSSTESTQDAYQEGRPPRGPSGPQTAWAAPSTAPQTAWIAPRRSPWPWSHQPSPPPEPWLVQPSLDSADTGRVSPIRRDGSWFMQLLHNETKRLEGWCKEMEREAEEHDLSEEILGKIRSAVGSAQLLMSQKFQQFYWLCQQNLDPSAMPRPTSQDLAGFWDLLQLSIDDVTAKFDELQQIKSNAWQLLESPDKKVNAALHYQKHST